MIKAICEPGPGSAWRTRLAFASTADKLGMRSVLVLGENEVAQKSRTVGDRAGSPQEAVPSDRVVDYLKEKLHG